MEQQLQGLLERDPNLLHRFTGVNGRIEVYPDKIVIKRQGWQTDKDTDEIKADKTIYVQRIAKVEMKPASLLSQGYFYFDVAEEPELLSRKKMLESDNTVLFVGKKNELAQKVKFTLDGMINPQEVLAQPVAPLSTPQLEEENYKKFKTKISGVTYYNEDGVNRQEIIQNLAVGHELSLLVEEEGGRVSVRVDAPQGTVGYIPKELTSVIAEKLESQMVEQVRVDQIFSPERKKNLSVYILILVKKVKKVEPPPEPVPEEGALRWQNVADEELAAPAPEQQGPESTPEPEQPKSEPKLPEQPAEDETSVRYKTKVAGVQQDNPDGSSRQDIIFRLSQGDELWLSLEEGAAPVVWVDSTFGILGSIPKELAPILTEKLRGGLVEQVWVDQISPFGREPQQVSVVIQAKKFQDGAEAGGPSPVPEFSRKEEDHPKQEPVPEGEQAHQPEEQPQPALATPPCYRFKTAVAGVNRDNADGTNRQEIIRNLEEGDGLTLILEEKDGGESVWVNAPSGPIGTITKDLTPALAEKLRSGLVEQVLTDRIFFEENKSYLSVHIVILVRKMAHSTEENWDGREGVLEDREYPPGSGPLPTETPQEEPAANPDQAPMRARRGSRRVTNRRRSRHQQRSR